MLRNRSQTFGSAALAALMITASTQAARTETFQAEYLVSIFGITIARSSFTSTLTNTAYEVTGRISSSGLAAIFDDTNGTVEASGRLGETKVSPRFYELDYTSGKKKQRTTVRLENGDVVATENAPPPKPRRHGWVPVEAAHLLDVVDPLTATLVQAETLDDVCNRSARIYDGEMRADLALTFLRKAPAAVGDFKGESVTCAIRFTPVSGYRKGSKTIEYLAAGNEMEVTFARMGDTSFFVPLRGHVETRIGTVHFRVGKINGA